MVAADWFVSPNFRLSEEYTAKTQKLISEEMGELLEAKNPEYFFVCGVPESETEQYLDEVKEMLETEALSDAEVHAHPDSKQRLEQSRVSQEIQEISYQDKPSRVADVQYMSETVDEDEKIAVSSFDYNLRTGLELKRQFGEGFEDQFLAKRPSKFPDFTLQNYVLSKTPGDYNMMEQGRSWPSNERERVDKDINAVVLNAPYSDDKDEYLDKLRSEAFRDGIRMMPGGQKLKDIVKRGVEFVRNDWDY